MKKLVEDLFLLAKLDRKPELHLQETRLDQLLRNGASSQDACPRQECSDSNDTVAVPV